MPIAGYARTLISRTIPIVVAVAAWPAAGAEYCVTCAGPAAMYACVVEGADVDAAPDPREQLLCITTLAKAADHESCSVPRSAPKPCPGILKIVALPETGLPDLPVAPPVEAAPSQPTGVGAAGEAAPPPKPNAPRTVEELAKETVKSSQAGIEKAGKAVTGTAKKAGDTVGEAGNAVGNAAKKTWDCMMSLFSDC